MMLHTPVYNSGVYPRKGGFALITVVLVLAALLLLCTPFLITARNADQASQQLFHKAQARIALNNASTHARAILEQSHPSFDTTRNADSLDELHVPTKFPEGFYNAQDERGVMWDARVQDVSGKIDLGSAPPQVFGSMLGSVSRLVELLKSDNFEEIALATVAGFDPQGFVWVGGELIKYGKITGNTLTQLERGYGSSVDSEDQPLPGPLPATDHGIGETVLEQRAFAPVEWRMFEGNVRAFDSAEQLEEVDAYTFPEQRLRPEHYRSLARLGSVYGGVGAGARWQRAARMTNSARADLDDSIFVDSIRWFSPGSTIRIKTGTSTELAVVRSSELIRGSGGGLVKLDRGLHYNYSAFEAEVSVLARRPVNINTASNEVLRLLMGNLSLKGRNQRITGGEARALAQLIEESRPFNGLQDFLRRLVLPAAGIEELPGDAPVIPDAFARGNASAVIGGWDAVALYRNALNANDYGLDFSTMPFCFTSKDVYDLSLRAVVNGESGVERYSAQREETRVVIPQEELQHIWTTQADLDDLLRLNREAPYWATGPEPTSREDPLGSQPPTRMWAHMGTFEGQLFLPGVVGNATATAGEDAPTPEHVFAEEDSADGFARLFQHTVDESADPELAGRMLHFTHDVSDPEGRYLPQRTYQTTPTDERLQWDAPQGIGLVRNFHFSCWIKPNSHANGHLLDVGGSSLDADRVSLLFEGGQLILRMLDGGGDHPGTPSFTEVAEVRYALVADGTSAGLPIDVWNHIEIDVRGSQPDQMLMLVNGLSVGVRPMGMSRLTGAIGISDAFIPLESTEGFPPEGGVVRIGNELIEYTAVSGNGLDATHILTGARAGFGGRQARQRWKVDSGVSQPERVPMGHPAGSTVQIYGYSLRLRRDAPAGKGTLPAELGMFRVGVVREVSGGPGGQFGESITIPVPGEIIPADVGTGILPSSAITGLVLGPAETPDDLNADVSQVMAAFNPQGGYACLMQVITSYNGGVDSNQVPIGGWSVIRYSGWSGQTLNVVAWGDQVNLPNLIGVDPRIGGGARALVVKWSPLMGPIQEMHNARLFVMPISLPMGGAPQTTFLTPNGSFAQFAQLTEQSAAERTEWVAYNSIQPESGGQLVRDNHTALTRAWDAATLGRPVRLDPVVQPPAPPSPPPPGPPQPPSAPAPTAANTQVGLGWQPDLGVIQDTDFPITRAVREAFLFRGVMRTFSYDHPVGTEIMPVMRAFSTLNADMPQMPQGDTLDIGRPGRFDPVFLMDRSTTALGWPVTIHRAHLTDAQFIANRWVPSASGQMVALPGQAFPGGAVDWERSSCYFTLTDASPAPVQAGTYTLSGSNQASVIDMRVHGRIMRFPSGERPRDVTTVTLGSAVNGSNVLAASVDEVVFGSSAFGGLGGGAPPEDYRGAQMVVAQDLASGVTGQPLMVLAGQVSLPYGTVFPYPSASNNLFLSALDQNGGLLRIGEEILAYEAVDAGSGVLTIAAGGRGLLGTPDSNHEIGAKVSYLDGFQVATLSGGISASTSAINVTSTVGFPREGTVLIGTELIHYTRIFGGALDMPRLSGEAGKMDGRGGGIFRGRYGTIPAGHTAGTPVILFPMRYWDRWAEQADGPELAYFGLDIHQPSAFWRSFRWEEESVGIAGVRLGVLMRSDNSIPWDADPEVTEGLEVFYNGDLQANWIGHQSPGLEWRVFVDYQAGAFDAITGQGHGWRTTPRLKNFIVDYLGPASVLRSVDR